jgi:hypothetical protein
MQLDECERLSWGGFERGPVHLIFEFSEDFSAPDSCKRGDPGRTHILRALWVDDAEVGQWLAATYGLPVRFATMGVNETGTAAGTIETWTWAQPGDAASEVRFERAAVAQDTPLTYRQRLFWFTSIATNFMDVEESFLNDDYASPVAQGTLQPPTIYTWTGQTTYAAVVDRVWNVQSTFAISLFNDFVCTEG